LIRPSILLVSNSSSNSFSHQAAKSYKPQSTCRSTSVQLQLPILLPLPCMLLLHHYGRHMLPQMPNALVEGTKTLGEAFPECNTRGRASGDASHGKGLPRVSKIVHSGKPLPSVILALGEDLTPLEPSAVFFEKSSSPSATLGEDNNPLPRVLHSRKKFDFFNPLPPVLGMGTRGSLFFCFSL
jgi:hypothetical protein